MSKDVGQHTQRYPDIFADQHGREYIANCEMKTNDPISLRVNNWSAPLNPEWARAFLLPPTDDIGVVKMVPRTERARRGYQVFVDYDAWLAKIDARTEARQQQLVAIAQESFKGADLLKIMDGTAVPAELLRYVGPEPLPPREAILAMRAGNPWTLGLSDKVPDAAMAMLERIRVTVERMRSSPASQSTADPFASGVEPDEVDEGAQVYVEPDPFAGTETTTATKTRKR